MRLPVENGDSTRDCGAMGGSSIAGMFLPSRGVRPNTPAHPLAGSARIANFSGGQPFRSQKIAFTSRRTAVGMRWNGPIRKNIIGHGVSGMSALGQDFRGGRDLLQVQGALALLDQPAGEHSRGVFLHPLIQEGRNFLAEISGMTETRELIALQRSARSREKKLPRGLRAGQGHRGLLEGRWHVNSTLITVNSTDR